MDKKDKRILMYIAFGVILFAAFMHIELVWKLLGSVVGLVFPVAAGLAAAFILSVPMRGFEKLIARLDTGRRLKEKTCQHIAMLLTFLSLLLILAVIITVTIPEIVRSVKAISAVVSEKWPEWMQWLDAHDINSEMFKGLADSVDVKQLIDKISGGGGLLLSSLVSASVSIVSGITEFVFAMVIAIYVLLDRKEMGAKCRRLLYAYVPAKHADRICRVSRLCYDIYSKFLSGQCLEACILGILIFAAFSVFGLPYAALIGMLTAVCAFIPYVGAFVSCVVGALLIFMTDPMSAVKAVIIYMAVQFVDNHFVYPNVVGGSVGLSPLLTIVAALIGGSLFGLAGMIFFIPLTAVGYTLLMEDTARREQHRQMQPLHEDDSADNTANAAGVRTETSDTAENSRG